MNKLFVKKFFICFVLKMVSGMVLGVFLILRLCLITCLQIALGTASNLEMGIEPKNSSLGSVRFGQSYSSVRFGFGTPDDFSFSDLGSFSSYCT